MIKIRTISYNLPQTVTDFTLETIEKCVNAWENQDFFFRTQRVTYPVQTHPFTLDQFDEVASFCKKLGIRWFNVPVDPWEANSLKDWKIAELLSRNEGAFCNVICTKEKKIRDDILQFVVDTIRAIGKINSSGNANFRFGASMNVAPNGPFFPFTYSEGKELGFSVGLEMAEEINTLFAQNPGASLLELRELLLSDLDAQISAIEATACRISQETGAVFQGIDFSLAPLPTEGSSVLTILERLGVKDINDTGMMFGTAFFTDTLKYLASRHKSVGFSGVMYSLLEDREYARLNDQCGFSMDRMIALSTMCGCGVDMVPIYANVPDSMIRTILMEVSCISSRLNKPLGVRLLTIENCSDGRTHIDEDQDFIVNTKIVPVAANDMIPFGGEFAFLRY